MPFFDNVHPSDSSQYLPRFRGHFRRILKQAQKRVFRALSFNALRAWNKIQDAEHYPMLHNFTLCYASLNIAFNCANKGLERTSFFFNSVPATRAGALISILYYA